MPPPLGPPVRPRMKRAMSSDSYVPDDDEDTDISDTEEDIPKPPSKTIKKSGPNFRPRLSSRSSTTTTADTESEGEIETESNKGSKPRSAVTQEKPRLPLYTPDEDYVARIFRDANPGKELEVFPKLFATSRQALNQTLPDCSRQYRGGVTYEDGTVQSIVLKGELGARSLISANRIITRIPGHQKLAKDGKYVPSTSYDEKNKHVKSFRAAIRDELNILVVLHPNALAGHDHLVRFPPEVRYCPMALFRAVDLLPEVINNVLAYFVELECLNLDECWWVSSDVLKAERERIGSLPDVETSMCETCGTESRKKTYNELSICINPGCPDVGTDHRKTPDRQKDLTGPDQLLYREALPSDAKPVIFSPPTLEQVCQEATEQETSKHTGKSALDKAVVCTVCHNCAKRKCFGSWQCRTPGCPAVLERMPSLEVLLAALDKPRIYKAPKFTKKNINMTEDYKIYDIGVQDGYHWHIMKLYGSNYLLHGSETPTQSKLPGGSDDQYRALATEAHAGRLAFEKAEKLVANMGEDELSGMHYRSCGEKYDFGMSYLALEEEDAEEPERESFERLKVVRDIGLRLLGVDPDVNRPNENMTTAYFPHQELVAHADKNTAPPILTRCLGDKETFTLYTKKEWFFDNDPTRTGNPGTPNAPKLGTYRDVKLRKAWAKFKMDTAAADATGYEHAKQKILAQKRSDRAVNHKALEWDSNQGDIMLMLGREIQDVYKHGIKAHGWRFGQILRKVLPAGTVVDDQGMSEQIDEFLKDKTPIS